MQVVSKRRNNVDDLENKIEHVIPKKVDCDLFKFFPQFYGGFQIKINFLDKKKNCKYFMLSLVVIIHAKFCLKLFEMITK